jgi:gamma-F420-2:alpha-L-glutamate ligase
VLEISRILNLDIAGVDLLFDDSGFKICEVNSSPGFEGMESCCGINVSDEIFKFIKIRLGKYN